MQRMTLRDPGIIANSAASAPPFPSTTSMKLWFDAKLGVLLSSAPASDGGTVDQWENQISTTDALQAGASNLRPIYRSTGGPNSGPALEFDGSNDFLEMANGTDTNHTNPMTFWCVFNVDDFSSHRTLFSKNSSGGAANWSSYINPPGFGGRVSFCQNSCADSGANAVSTSTWYSIFYRVTSTPVCQIYWDNAFKGSLSLTAGSNAFAAYLGRRVDGLYFDGKMAAMGSWDRELNETERGELNAYTQFHFGV